MSKKILSLMLVACMILSSMTIVFAEYAHTFTLAGGEFDATAVNVGDTITLPVTIDVLKDRTAAVQYDIDYDKTVLEFEAVEAAMHASVQGIMLLPTTPVWGTNTTVPGKLSVFFADATQAPQQGTMGFYAMSITDPTYGTDVLFNIKFKVLANTANTTITPTVAIVSDYSTGSETPYQMSAGNVTAPACTVKFVEESAPADVTWKTATDAGYYTQDETVYGLMRFLFDVATEGVVTETGIKYLKAENIAETIAGAEVSGTSKTFYGDVVAIDEGTTGNYYAAAYAVVDGETRWSAPVSCTPDFVKAVIK